MRFPKSNQPDPLHGAHRDAPSKSFLDQLLPPDPKAPPRPTVPAPTCGTLPPQLPSVLGSLLGSLGRSGRIGR